MVCIDPATVKLIQHPPQHHVARFCRRERGSEESCVLAGDHESAILHEVVDRAERLHVRVRIDASVFQERRPANDIGVDGDQFRWLARVIPRSARVLADAERPEVAVGPQKVFEARMETPPLCGVFLERRRHFLLAQPDLMDDPRDALRTRRCRRFELPPRTRDRGLEDEIHQL